jgi:F-type H+-transporting ATPase subunit b
MLSARRSSNACSIGKRRDPLTRNHATFPLSRLHRFRTRRVAALRALIALTAFAWVLTGAAAPIVAAPQSADPAQPAAGVAQMPPTEAAAHGQPAAAEGHGAAAAAKSEGGAEGEGHGESPWALVARLFNFAILAGGLFYLLRSPLMGFLEQRGVSVRSELKKAADLKKEAAAQIEQIDERMKALPGEIDALKRRGSEEIKAEEARIQALAETERRRLLDQAKREIGTQLRIAERDLKKRAGELAVEVATERVKRTITARDHARLVERYVSQVRH